MNRINKEKWYKFILYSAVLIMINLVSGTLFFRLDLTRNKIYSLSDASKELVATLEEPMTIRIFLSENLPSPYNNLQQQVRDLMEEYSLEGNKNFNYTLYLLDQEGTRTDKEGRNLRSMAENYNIPAIQIQNVDQDEISLQNAYMGLTIIQGDLIETIPALAKESNLEYLITSTMDKMSRKSRSLLSMHDQVKIQLILSQELIDISKDLDQYDAGLKDLVSDLNVENFGKLRFEKIDPAEMNQDVLKTCGLHTIRIDAGKNTPAAPIEAYAGVLIRYNSELTAVNLLNQDLFGYHITALEDLKTTISNVVEKQIGVNSSIAYLVDHGTPSLYANPYQNSGKSVENFNRLISDNYNLKGVTLDKIPDNIKTLIINGPTEVFSDWELFELDQYIMKGGNVAFFLDSFRETMPSQQEMMYGKQPEYSALDTGLNKLLHHYGVDIDDSIVMDENCYKQQRQDRNGSIRETSIYFAPQIDRKDINNSRSFMKDINGLIALNISPVEVVEDSTIRAVSLFSSSDKAWIVKENINLYNPAAIIPPSGENRKKQDLALLLEGPISSYFTDKDIPEQPLPEDADKNKSQLNISSETISSQGGIETENTSAEIFVMASSAMLGNNILDGTGETPNSRFIQNIIDVLNDREDYAVMRSKGESILPLGDFDQATRTFVKGFNIIGLPILVIMTGAIVWFFWKRRKKAIALLFCEGEQ
ncbi:MAG: hypothetical protein B6241_03615 [Spirochaetaceae bacterium 4572_59]|nr:MAG: hypothetical protein B6241_03615 [Spirochaetaceae bacterium 4572_59]